MGLLRLSRVAFFGRTAAEYETLWGFRIADLKGKRVLDCPSGPGSFVAHARAMGIDAVGCDPLYQLGSAEIRSRGEADIADCMAKMVTGNTGHAGADPAQFARDKKVALDALLADFARFGSGAPEADGRYLCAALPTLPFADQTFDMTLCAHFLMSYAPIADGGIMESNDFDLAFHLRAVGELARVTRAEIRLYPSYALDLARPSRHPYATPMIAHLNSLGFATRYQRTTYDEGCLEFNDVLIASRTTQTR